MYQQMCIQCSCLMRAFWTWGLLSWATCCRGDLSGEGFLKVKYIIETYDLASVGRYILTPRDRYTSTCTHDNWQFLPQSAENGCRTVRWLLKNKRDTHRCCWGTANGAPLVWSCSRLLMNMTWICICSRKPLPNTSKAILARWWALGHIQTRCQVERSPTSLSNVISPTWVMHAGALTSVLSAELYSRGIAHTAAHLAKVA